MIGPPDRACLARIATAKTDDENLFHPDGADLLASAETDVEALRSSGVDVELKRSHVGLVEAIVGHEEHGFTKIQWVEAGSWNFFDPVPDSDFGYRPHMADLAVNKVLASSGRRAVRDYVDLVLIQEHVMPLWHAVWAAPGKDESWTPTKLLEKIAATNQFRQADLATQVASLVDLSAGEIGRAVREAVEEARSVFERLDPETAGHLFVDARGELVNDVDRIVAGDAISLLTVERGGAWPSGPDINAALIDRVVNAFGWEGSGEEPERGSRIGTRREAAATGLK
jgi:hypothetical protein